MTYESTGEIRQPKDGEFYLACHSRLRVPRKVLLHISTPIKDSYWAEGPRVIMREVKEEKQ